MGFPKSLLHPTSALGRGKRPRAFYGNRNHNFATSPRERHPAPVKCSARLCSSFASIGRISSVCECESFSVSFKCHESESIHLSVINHSYRTWHMTQRHLNYVPVPTLTVPREVPVGQVLAHNDIAHDENTPSGERGFHGWFQERLPSRAKLVLCDCGFWIAAFSGGLIIAKNTKKDHD